MDFLISHGFSSSNSEFQKRLSRKTLIKYHSIHRCEVAELTIFSTGAPLTSRDALFVFDGSILGEGIFISNFCTVNINDLNVCFNKAKDKLEGISGSFCICKINKKDGSFELTVDPLSAYMVFFYRDKHKYAVSNNIYFLEELLRKEGVATERRIESYIGEIAFGSNEGFFSGVSNLHTLKPLAYLTGSTDLTIHNETSAWCHYSGDQTYEYYLEKACHEISCNLDNILERADTSQSYYDITGGIDSRIIFAALYHKGRHSELPFRCIRRYPHPDGHYAAFIAEKYNLPRVGHVHDLGNVIKTDSDELFLSVFASMGFGDKSGSAGMAYYPNSVHIHGCFGEIAGASPITKRAYSGQEFTSARQIVEAYTASLKRLGVLSYFTKAGEVLVERLFSEKLDELVGNGVPPSFLSQAFYIETRNRSHFGMISKIRGQRRIYPDVLNNINLVRAASKLTANEVTFGKFHFDLIQKFGGNEILFLPLAENKWPVSFGTEKATDRLESISPIRNNSSRLFNLETKGNDVVFRRQMTKIDESGKQIPRQFRDTFYMQRILREKLPVLPPNHVLFKYIDKDRLLNVAHQAPEKITKWADLNIIRSIAQGMIWMFSEEKPFGYSVLYDYEQTSKD